MDNSSSHQPLYFFTPLVLLTRHLHPICCRPPSQALRLMLGGGVSVTTVVAASSLPAPMAAALADANIGGALLNALLTMCTDDTVDCRLAGLERWAALGKYAPALVTAKQHVTAIVPVAFGRLGDSTLPVKHAAKHTVYYCLGLHTGEDNQVSTTNNLEPHHKSRQK